MGAREMTAVPDGWVIESSPQAPAPDAGASVTPPAAAPPLDDMSRDLITRTVLGEAAGESHEGRAGVAAVIRNRLNSGKFGATPADVVLAKNQFEPWSTPQGRGRMMSYSADSPEYGDASAAVDRVFGDEQFDPTSGSTHFFAPNAQAALGRAPPKWAQGEPVTIGGHAFYAPGGRVQTAPPSPDATQPPPDVSTPSENATTSPASAAPPIPEGFQIESAPAAPNLEAAPEDEKRAAGIAALEQKFAAGEKPNTDEVRVAGNRESAQTRGEKQMSGQFLHGVPVLGAFTDQAGAAASAAAQPATGVGAEGPTFRERYVENAANEKADREAFEKANPKASMALQAAGGVAATLPIGASAVGARALGITGPNIASRVATSAATNSGLGAADAAARGEDVGGGAKAGAIAGLIAPVAGAVISRVARPTANSPAREAMVNTLRAEGVEATAGQTSGSKALRYSEGSLGEMPGSGAAAADLTERQGEAFTRAALRRAGTDAPRATADVMQATADRLGNQFETLSARNTMRLDQQFGQDIGRTLREYDRVLPSQQREIVANVVDDILAHGRTMPGDIYQEARSRLSRQSFNMRQSDPTLSEALGGVRDALDAAMRRSISPADRAAWDTARRQYGNMKVLEKAISGAGENSALGLISPSQLRTAVATRNRGAYVRGQGDLTDLARAGEAILRPLPNSGTAPRLMAAQLLTHGVGGLVGGTAGAGSDAGVVPGAIAGALAPGLAGRALLSRPAQAYLANRVVSAPAAEALRRGTVALADTQARRLSDDRAR